MPGPSTVLNGRPQ